MARKRKTFSAAPHTEDIVEDFVPDVPDRVTSIVPHTVEPGKSFLPESTFVGTPSQNFADSLGESLLKPSDQTIKTPDKKGKKGKKGEFLKNFDFADFGTNAADIINKVLLGVDLGQNAALRARRAFQTQSDFQQQQLAAQREEAAAGRDFQAGEGAKERTSKEKLEGIRATNELEQIQARGVVEQGVLDSRIAGQRGSNVLSTALAHGVNTTALQGIDLNTPEGAARGAALMAPGIRRSLRANLDAKAAERAELRDAAIIQNFTELRSGFQVITDANGLRQRVPNGLGSTREQALAVIQANLETMQENGRFLPANISERKDAWVEESLEQALATNTALSAEFDEDARETWEATYRQQLSEDWDTAMQRVQKAIDRFSNSKNVGAVESLGFSNTDSTPATQLAPALGRQNPLG